MAPSEGRGGCWVSWWVKRKIWIKSEEDSRVDGVKECFSDETERADIFKFFIPRVGLFLSRSPCRGNIFMSWRAQKVSRLPLCRGASGRAVESLPSLFSRNNILVQRPHVGLPKTTGDTRQRASPRCTNTLRTFPGTLDRAGAKKKLVTVLLIISRLCLQSSEIKTPNENCRVCHFKGPLGFSFFWTRLLEPIGPKRKCFGCSARIGTNCIDAGWN